MDTDKNENESNIWNGGLTKKRTKQGSLVDKSGLTHCLDTLN